MRTFGVIFSFILSAMTAICAVLALFALFPATGHPFQIAAMPLLLGMAGPITSGNFARALWPGVKHWFGRSYDEHATEFDKIFDVETSDKAYELGVGYVSTGLAQFRPEGDGVAYDSMQSGFETKSVHLDYGLGYVITQNAYDDNLYPELIKSYSQSLAFSLRQTKEIVCANGLNRTFSGGTGGTQQLHGDGSTWISTTHANKSGGTYSNQIAVAADLSEAALEQACIDISKYKNDRGLNINVKAEKLILPFDMMFEAHRILKSVGQNDTANNATNALRDMGMFPEGIMAGHFFTNTKNWWIKTNCPNGLKFWERRPMTLTSPKENDFATDNAKYKATERYSISLFDPRGIYGSAPS